MGNFGKPVGTFDLYSGEVFAICSYNFSSYLEDPLLDLRRGHVDDNGASRYNKTQSTPDSYVTDLQNDLMTMGIEDVGEADGDFGRKTEEAVKIFQNAALTPYRLVNSNPMSISEVTYQGSANGIVDNPVKEEIKMWLNNGYKIVEIYGGYTLKLNDKDSEKRWGGEVRAESGEYVKELQNDLVSLGYWISHPDSEDGMNADGSFGNRVRGGVFTFQKEHELTSNGEVDIATAWKIKALLSNTNFERPGHGTPYGRFYQLQPSKDYGRYSPNYDSDHVMDDVWGTKETIDMIKNTATAWMGKGKQKFLVGDISKYNGGQFPPHKTHRDGTGVDLDSDAYCSINRTSFNKEASLELAQILVNNGATRILFNCKYVIDKCNKVYALSMHHHHMHVDTKAVITIPQAHPEEECKLCKKSVYDSCDYKDKAERQDKELTQ